MKRLEETIGYTFHNSTTLTNALTHSSYANESGRHIPSNERLEFLGDAVLSDCGQRSFVSPFHPFAGGGAD